MIVFIKTQDGALQQLNATIQEVGNGKGEYNAQLKIYRDDASDKLYANIPYNYVVAASFEGTEFQQYLYLGKDDEGYIFQSNP